MRAKTKLKRIDKLKHFNGAILPPIYQQSTIIFASLQEFEKAKYNYGRQGTFTNRVLQKKIAKLENASQSFITPSGASAIYLALLALVQKDDHILICKTAYGPTKYFSNNFLNKLGVSISYFSGDCGCEIKKLIKPNTKLIFMESPSSIFYQVQELETIVKIAKERNIYTVIDNTYSASLLFKPLDYGVDISVLSASKYYSGHADLIMGALAAREKLVCTKLKSLFNLMGYHTSPFDCYLTIRGLETLKIRLKAQAKSAKKIAQFLETREEIEQVLYPSLKSFPQYERFKRYFKRANGLITFSFKEKYSEKKIRDFIDALKCFGIGYSWGGCESIVLLCGKEYARNECYPKDQLFVRFSIGLENVKMLKRDITNAFGALN